ncbi:hypothetical protein GCM10011344_27330 [Dokdonia pacifica]|uniref:Lipoprotein n=1 Tax=Dokdonia pacifica TaxID=1627892 RepID=A0A239E6A9_9FLAO|nr:hypothetical protein [Dokdonia pacifica]GGG25184.1 hypothetical protein GCM10011344_27330 [Dokdonia pacifica]SNS39818.1 hypothetical protein SAMN06265376_11411 [Dokdonia pacifica]
MKLKHTHINISLFSLGCFILLLGCSTTKQLEFAKEKSNTISLGAIVKKEGALKNNVEIKGVPDLDQKIRVSVIEKEFTKASFSKYVRIFDTQKPSIEFDDTTENKPTYFEIELIDDIGYASSINNDVTSREYVKNSKKAGVVSKIVMVSKSAVSFENMTSAFLEEIENQYVVNVYNNEELLATLSFSEIVVFDYQISFFCYGKNQRNQVVIMDIVEEGKSCKRPLERKAEKLETIKKLIDY